MTIDVDHAWSVRASLQNRKPEESFGRRQISVRWEQKINLKRQQAGQKVSDLARNNEILLVLEILPMSGPVSGNQVIALSSLTIGPVAVSVDMFWIPDWFGFGN
jgi:hypothetical protein